MRRTISNVLLCSTLLLVYGTTLKTAQGQQIRGFAPNPTVVTGPGGVNGTIVNGPVVSGPVVSGPVVSGPVVSGPVVSGPVVSGPVASVHPWYVQSAGGVNTWSASPPAFSTAPFPTAVTTYRVDSAPNVTALQPIGRPTAPVVSRPVRPVYMGRGIIGQPKLYVEGQPVRNALRFLTP